MPADYTQFLKAITRTGHPDHLPAYEHIASSGFISRRLGKDINAVPAGSREYWQMFVDFWLGMGLDVVPMEISLNCPLGTPGGGGSSFGSESRVVIASWEDFEKYPWPDVSNPLEFSHFDTVAELLPEGAKIVGGVCMGPYEWLSEMMGTIGLSYALADEPELVEAVAAKIGELHISADRQIAQIDAVCALRQGDDLGFNSSTFLSPELLQKLIFPTYKQMVQSAHDAGKPFVLHSCGNLSRVYEELITDIKIDAKHSYEEKIMPVEEFKKQYGERCTPMGGLDVDFICRRSEQEIRAYTRSKIDQCFADGYYTIGTGNSLTDYMPVENYMTVLDEARRYTA
ncbi:MAG: uroporphyrinogen decarboxylase family protein [Armatimonadota bacterium]